jgi:putative ABC transport system ATP-binding protein
MNVVHAENVTKTYGTGDIAFQALRGVSLSVDAGEFIMLSGPSGSGKTTLLSILGCVLRPTSGFVSLMGEDLSHSKENELPSIRRHKIGFIFQGHNLLASLSARDNVSLVLEMRGHGRKESEKEAEELLVSVGLGGKENHKPADLSGGQRQRVSIARALAGKPPLILADEPTASLDAANGMQVTMVLKDLAKKQGRTVVVVTHDNRIYHLADRIIYIEDGLIKS